MAAGLTGVDIRARNSTCGSRSCAGRTTAGTLARAMEATAEVPPPVITAEGTAVGAHRVAVADVLTAEVVGTSVAAEVVVGTSVAEVADTSVVAEVTVAADIAKQVVVSSLAS